MSQLQSRMASKAENQLKYETPDRPEELQIAENTVARPPELQTPSYLQGPARRRIGQFTGSTEPYTARNNAFLQSGQQRRGKLPLLKRSPFTIELEKSRNEQFKRQIQQAESGLYGETAHLMTAGT